MWGEEMLWVWTLYWWVILISDKRTKEGSRAGLRIPKAMSDGFRVTVSNTTALHVSLSFEV